MMGRVFTDCQQRACRQIMQTEGKSHEPFNCKRCSRVGPQFLSFVRAEETVAGTVYALCCTLSPAGGLR